MATLGFLIHLKVFQRLGYTVATSEIPALIIEYIAACAQIPLSSRDLAGYDDSGTRRRHLPLIREALSLSPYGPPARKAFLRAMVEAARTKDDLADLINVALEELVRCRFELPAFGTLDRAAHHARAVVAHGIYRQVERRLSEETRVVLDTLFVVEPTTFWSGWQDLKRDPASPTLTHMKLLIAHLVSISERRNLLAPDLFTGVPHGKINQKGKEALQQYHLEHQSRTDALVMTLRDLVVAYRKEGSTEERFAAIEGVIGEQSEEVLKQCEEHLAKAFVAHVRAWLEDRARQTDATFYDSKLEHSVARYLTAVFCFGCNLGPSQTSRSLDAVDRRDVTWVNQRHITIENLDEAIRLVIHAYHRFDLPRFWGTGKHASADGTKWEMYEQNLLAEYHIRYGGYGGIGYYHVSDNYIARFSHFIPCGVWEGSFILDIFEQEDKEPKPETLHGDTQAQSSTIFGMAYLLGIALMPRIRNWKDLNLFRPSQDAHYTHIETLFSDTVDWNVIETHLPDMLRVVLSVKAGTIRPSTILRKLGTYSRRNKLYQAFRELGDVVRTEFLLHLLGDPDLRSMLQSAMNKSEAFNGFAKWVLFGGEGVIAENRREEQRKIIKFNHLVANCVIFYNVFVVSKELQKLALEGREFDEQAVAALSPYIRHHINRFGHYELDLTQHSPPIEYDLPIPTKKRQEKPPGQAALAKRKKKPKKKRKKTATRQMKLFEEE